MSSIGTNGSSSLFAMLRFVWLYAWVSWITNNPRNSHLISQAELRLIQARRKESPTGAGKFPPVLELLSKIPTWAIIVANVINNWVKIECYETHHLFCNSNFVANSVVLIFAGLFCTPLMDASVLQDCI